MMRGVFPIITVPISTAIMHNGSALDALHRSSPSFSTLESERYTVPTTVLRAEGLIKIYGKRRVVDGVSFHVNKGEIVGLLGPNGAGKTTSFRMACGLINTNGGIVYLGNQDVTSWPMYRRSKEGGMGYLPQEKSVFQKLTVQNNLNAVMELLGVKRNERRRRCDELLEKFQLTHLRHNYAGGLSGGERRRLEIARCLVSDPKIILLDEPFAAVDPITVYSIQDIIRFLAAEGIAVLITDHNFQETLKTTHRTYLVEAGCVLCHGTPLDVLDNSEARRVYFGKDIDFDGLRRVLIDNAAALAQSVKTKKLEPMPENVPTDTKRKPENRKPEPQPESEPIKAPATKRHLRPSREEVADPATASTIIQTRTDPASADETPSSIISRPIGRRLVPSAPMPERPIVRSSGEAKHVEPAKPEPPEEDVAAEMSGIIRSLGAMIWKK